MNFEYIQCAMKKFGITKLHKMTNISRSHLYGIQKGSIDPTLPTFEKVAYAMGFQITMIPIGEIKHNLDDYDYFRWSLASYGAPILVSRKFINKPDINKLLHESLRRGRSDAEINTVLPRFIFKNFELFDWDLVLERTSEKAYLGYLLNLINHFECEPQIASLYSKIYIQYRPKRVTYLIKKSKIGRFEKSKLNNTENKIASAWKFKTLDTIETLQARYDKWS